MTVDVAKLITVQSLAFRLWMAIRTGDEAETMRAWEELGEFTRWTEEAKVG